ncbi:MAG TPA: amidohydrolase family protein, partial [Vicinamibacterales bacterium]|nr:amidohydrolase family protein [Vicinamibacterales bacterium]
MTNRRHLLLVQAAAAIAAALAFAPIRAASFDGPLYAIRGARIFTAAGAPIDNGVVVMRNGVIEGVGAAVTVPPDAVVIDASGMSVYPGLIDMGNDATLEPPSGAGAQGAQAGRGGGGGRGGGAPAAQMPYEEVERAKRAQLLRPDFVSADNLRTESPEQTQLASAGVTTVLARTESGIFKGQSALVNVLVPPDRPQVSEIADYRKGLAVLKSPVASHIDIGGRAGGPGYPNSLLGSIAFTRQALLDAAWQRDAEARYQKQSATGQRPVVEPALEALRPLLARQLPAAFDANLAREIDRVLAIASEFNLDPIVVGASGAADRTAELAAAKARVILSLNFPGGQGGGGGRGGGRGGGGGAQPSLQELKERQNAPKVPAALAQASIPFAFTSGGATPADFVRNAGRVVSEGGLPADAALRALTIDAAKIAGAADRVGSIEKGKAANVIVTEGDLF